MLKESELILSGYPVRKVLEGTFSDIHIELTDRFDDLLRKVEKAGNPQVGNVLNPDQSAIKIDFDDIISLLDEYNMGAKQFVDDATKKNPNITYAEIIAALKEQFL